MVGRMPRRVNFERVRFMREMLVCMCTCWFVYMVDRGRERGSTRKHNKYALFEEIHEEITMRNAQEDSTPLRLAFYYSSFPLHIMCKDPQKSNFFSYVDNLQFSHKSICDSVQKQPITLPVQIKIQSKSFKRIFKTHLFEDTRVNIYLQRIVIQFNEQGMKKYYCYYYSHSIEKW